AWHRRTEVPRMNSLMSSPWLAAGSALFLWWFSTGLILWRVRHADNIGPAAHARSVLFALPLLLTGAAGFAHSATDPSTLGTYTAFLSALAIWGWIELAFLSGIITGPNATPCPQNLPLLPRFLRGFGTIAWHEALLAATLALMFAATRDAPNTIGLWTFAVLFFARISAKLNLFFGVPRINTEFLPKPLAHLSSHFRRAPMNWVFPISITALSFAAACWMERAVAAPTNAAFIGHILLAALTLLALLEHWFMVLPLPDAKLWAWMIPNRRLAILEKKEPTHGL
ncbi:MAG: putative photosynthetic complex assembly protein PuhE, partial [Paracoccaceae bacterium]